MREIPFDKIKAAIFDLDGTLLDSMGVWADIDVEFLARRGIPVPDDYQDAITPLGPHAAAEYTIRRFGFPETVEEIMDEWFEMAHAAYRDTLQLKPGALAYVDQVRALGWRTALATSSLREMVEAALLRTGLDRRLDVVRTVAEVSHGKNHPEIYLACAKEMGVEPEECVVFEDIIIGIESAKSAGFYTVGVHEARYARTDEVRSVADLYIQTFSELMIS